MKKEQTKDNNIRFVSNVEVTAVEWLINEHFGGIENCTPDFRNKIEQAKEMEKEQKESFYKIGYLDGESKVRNFNENIYNETFKSE